MWAAAFFEPVRLHIGAEFKRLFWIGSIADLQSCKSQGSADRLPLGTRCQKAPCPQGQPVRSFTPRFTPPRPPPSTRLLIPPPFVPSFLALACRRDDLGGASSSSCRAFDQQGRPRKFQVRLREGFGEHPTRLGGDEGGAEDWKRRIGVLHRPIGGNLPRRYR
jgi:hypothetical protein